ncbi:protein kinase [Pendulispora albinea]|uniref:Protein kinase n=1 Tax=Pendulispora albinea TaxID=2741071 RepID=A0ABZ2LS11_9BACT
MARPTPLPPVDRRRAIALSSDVPGASGSSAPPDRRVILGAELGRGNASTVFAGVLESPHGVQRRVAVKVIDASTHDEQEPVPTAIFNAVKMAALIVHPNVAATYEVVFEGHTVMIISELIDGCTLEAFIDAYTKMDRKVPPDLALFMATEIAEGLAAARDTRNLEGGLLNMSHGELSAREVLVSWNGEVKLTDFGLAQAIRPASGVRNIRSFARRAATLAPEVAKGRRPDARSDVFALGILMREMLVGPRWSPSISDQDAFARAREGDIEMNVLEPRLYEPVAEILNRALELDPSNRFPHAGAMAFELRRASLPLGIGDNRLFLRHAMHDMLAIPPETDQASEADRTAPARRSRTGHL